MLIIDHLTHIYEKDTAMAQAALDDISLVIRDGEFVGLIGHTGSGKSTLVQHLNGLLKPTSGHVYHDGADIHDDGFDRKALRGRIGLVFQYPEHQLFESDVFSDVCFGPKNLGLDKLEVELRAYQALKQVGIKEDLFYQSPFDLSGGEKRRAAIAGVLAMRPQVLILDEPTAGLDPRGRDEILGLIAALWAESGITVILVSHSMEEVAKYVGRIVVMNGGRVAYDDVPAVIFSDFRRLEEIGLGAPPMVYVMDALRQRGLDVDSAALTVAAAYENIMKALAHA